jgi:hypothetical protein
MELKETVQHSKDDIKGSVESIEGKQEVQEVKTKKADRRSRSGQLSRWHQTWRCAPPWSPPYG